MKSYNPTEAELALILTRPGYAIVGEPPPPPPAPHDETPCPPDAREQVPRYRSKTEARYAQQLAFQQSLGQITTWWYEPLGLWLAPGMRYTPDFLTQGGAGATLHFAAKMPVTLSPAFAASLVHLAGAGLTCIEVKPSAGHVFEPRRALDRLKMAASLYPMFVFRVAQWDRTRHHWTETPV